MELLKFINGVRRHLCGWFRDGSSLHSHSFSPRWPLKLMFDDYICGKCKNRVDCLVSERCLVDKKQFGLSIRCENINQEVVEGIRRFHGGSVKIDPELIATQNATIDFSRSLHYISVSIINLVQEFRCHFKTGQYEVSTKDLDTAIIAASHFLQFLLSLELDKQGEDHDG